MNKKMRELLAKIAQKQALAKAYKEGDGVEKDLDKSLEILTEIEELQKEYKIEEKLYNDEKEDVAEQAENKETKTSEETATTKLANGVRALIKKDYNVEGVSASGGYTVPEEIETKVQNLRETKESLIDLVTVKTVKTNKGQETYKKRGQYTGFSSVEEGGKIPKKGKLQFSRLVYSITKYGGYMPVSNELLEDSDSDIEAMIVDWLANESRATRNNLVLTTIKSKDAVNLENLDGIKKALNVTLSKFKNSSVIITNNDGMQYLDTLKDANGRPLLNPDPTNPANFRLRAGTTTVGVKEYDNETIPSNGSNVPFYIGDFKEGIKFFDRKQLSLLVSNVASVGSGDDEVNAFEEDLTLIRGIEREDIEIRDDQAFVNGYINVAPTTSDTPSRSSEIVA